MAKWTKQKAISLAFQELALRKLFPMAKSSIKRSELTWLGTLRPSPLSCSYQVRLRYKLNGSPKIEILHPRLETRMGKKPPHLYSGERLCLYLPNTGEWGCGMLLSEVIVPWTSEWLLNYEIWLATGHWCGGGIHPQKARSRRA